MRLHLVTGLAAVVVALSGTPASGAGPLPPLPLPPVNIVPPAIAGNAVVGSAVVCTPGQWLNAPTGYQYSWQRNLITISGPSSEDQYTLTPSDAGQLVTCTVTAANGTGAGAPAISSPIVPVSGTQAGQGGPGGGSAGPGAGGGGSAGAGGGASAGGSSGGSNSIGSGYGSVTSTGGVGGSGPPALSSFSVRPRRMVVITTGTHARTHGMTLEYNLAQPAQIVIVIEKRVTGHVPRTSCRVVAAASKKAAPCQQYVALQTLIVKPAPAGKSRVWYSGRVSDRLLGNGSYRAIAAAVTMGGWSPTRSSRFSVVCLRGR